MKMHAGVPYTFISSPMKSVAPERPDGYFNDFHTVVSGAVWELGCTARFTAKDAGHY